MVARELVNDGAIPAPNCIDPFVLIPNWVNVVPLYGKVNPIAIEVWVPSSPTAVLAVPPANGIKVPVEPTKE